jgi:hypothetical protein
MSPRLRPLERGERDVQGLTSGVPKPIPPIRRLTQFGLPLGHLRTLLVPPRRTCMASSEGCRTPGLQLLLRRAFIR